MYWHILDGGKGKEKKKYIYCNWLIMNKKQASNNIVVVKGYPMQCFFVRDCTEPLERKKYSTSTVKKVQFEMNS